MGTVILVVGLLLVGGVLYYRFSKRHTLARMQAGVVQVKSGLAVYLIARYIPQVGRETASRLAAGVVNELFGDPPSNETGEAFLQTHQAEIESRLADLRHEDLDTRSLITQALRVHAIVRYGSHGTVEYENIQRAEELGILVPGGDGPSPETFLPMAQSFCSRHLEATRHL